MRLPAAFTSVVGFKPSYGLLSRWGVVAYANSLDTVGILGRQVSAVRDTFGMSTMARWLNTDGNAKKMVEKMF